MRNLMRVILAGAVTVPTVMALTGCLPGKGGLRGPGHHDDDGSVLTSTIGGIEDSDLQRSGLNWWLICSSGIRIKGEANTDKTKVRFSGDQVVDGDKCAMEVTIPKEDADKLDWDWFGVEKGAPRIGLMYGSNEDTVTARALKLKLYRLYAPKSANSFTATLNITFELAQGQTLPAPEKTTGSLICGDNLKYPGTFSKTGDKDGTLTFASLRVKDMKGKTCGKIAVLVDNKEAFAGDTPDVTFKEPKKDVPLLFPEDKTKRYTVKASGGDLQVDVDVGGPCLKRENSKCLDRRDADLPWSKNYMIAKIQGLTDNGKGEKVTMLVGAGPAFGIFDGAKLSIDDIRNAMKKDAADADKKRFSFYRETIQEELFKAAFDEDFVKGKAVESSIVPKEELESVLMLHIDQIWVHGFRETDDKTLNALPSAHWMTMVKAEKAGSPAIEFIAAGKVKYFYSPSAPISILSKTMYFDYATLITEMTSTAGSEKWAVYSVKGGALADATCAQDKSYFMAEMSLRHLGNLKPESGADALLDACEVQKDKFKADMATGYTVTATYYVWDWFKLAN